MNTEERAAAILSNKLGIDVQKEEIGHETQWLYKDEIDERLVPAHLMEQLEETVIFNAAGYEDEDGTYYLLLQLYLPNDEIHEIWLVNDVVATHFTEGMDEG